MPNYTMCMARQRRRLIVLAGHGVRKVTKRRFQLASRWRMLKSICWIGTFNLCQWAYRAKFISAALAWPVATLIGPTLLLSALFLIPSARYRVLDSIAQAM